MTDISPSVPAAPGSPGGSGADKSLLILAADHRNSLERDLYRLPAPPTPVESARICADKLIIYQALLDAAEHFPPGAQPGILIDEEYGGSVAELASRSGGAVNLSMPVEASGQEWFHFAYGDDWRSHADFFATNHSKVLVRDNPGFDAGQRHEQAGRLAQVSSWAVAAGRPLILELLIPATDSDLKAFGGDHDRYDDELRPGLTLAAIAYLQENGVEPAIWKVEGLDHEKDAAAVVEAAHSGGRKADCIVLGRHAPREKLDHWLETAAPIPGFVGFAIGRSIWWDPLVDLLDGKSDSAQARQIIASNYLDYANFFMRARERRP
jgi:myo-inositol catabolism protein IolC